jgi:hypothetical protein
MKPKTRKILLITLCTLVTAIPVGGHLLARHNAFKFGRAMAGSFSCLGREAFADTDGLRKFLASPDMASPVSTVDSLSFLNGDYDEWIRDLQAGLIYYSEQASVPQPQRFAAPPRLKHFKIDTTDPSDEGLGKAAGALIVSYLKRFQRA